MACASEALLDCARARRNADLAALEARAPARDPAAYVRDPLSFAASRRRRDRGLRAGPRGKLGGKSAGRHGACGVFSFYATKLITNGRPGRDARLRGRGARRRGARDYRQFAWTTRPQGALQLPDDGPAGATAARSSKRLSGFLARREELFQRYRTAGLPLLDGPAGTCANRAVAEDDAPARVLAAGRRRQGDRARRGLGAARGARRFPNAAALTRSTVSLPCYPSLSDAEADAVIAAVRRA